MLFLLQCRRRLIHLHLLDFHMHPLLRGTFIRRRAALDVLHARISVAHDFFIADDHMASMASEVAHFEQHGLLHVDVDLHLEARRLLIRVPREYLAGGPVELWACNEVANGDALPDFKRRWSRSRVFLARCHFGLLSIARLPLSSLLLGSLVLVPRPPGSLLLLLLTLPLHLFRAICLLLLLFVSLLPLLPLTVLERREFLRPLLGQLLQKGLPLGVLVLELAGMCHLLIFLRDLGGVPLLLLHSCSLFAQPFAHRLSLLKLRLLRLLVCSKPSLGIAFDALRFFVSCRLGRLLPVSISLVPDLPQLSSANPSTG